MLSSDLATLFTGRCVEVHVLPFSFYEYRAYVGAGDIDAQFDGYVKAGGMAGSYPYPDEEARMAYIRSVYETIAERDLVQKRSISNVAAFSAFTEYMMDNIGNLNSANSISAALKEGRRPSSHVTAGNHMRYLREAYLFYRVKRYNIKGKRCLETKDKSCLVDSGFRWAVLGMRNMDYGRLYENIVAIELMRRGWDIYVGKLYQKEVDFVAMRGTEKVNIQVSDDIGMPVTFEREMDSRLRIKDAYPKMLIARTRHDVYNHQGVAIIDIARWLDAPEMGAWPAGTVAS